jgi:stress response protein YsnF
MSSQSRPWAPAPGSATATDATTEDAVMIRSEERLHAGTVNVVVGRARLVTSIVVEEQTFTVPVRRQEVRLVHEPLPAHEQVITDTAPAEEVYEVVRYAEQVLVTTEVVPVERVRLVKHVVTTQEAVTGQVRSEQVDVERTGAGDPTDPPVTPS